MENLTRRKMGDEEKVMIDGREYDFNNGGGTWFLCSWNTKTTEIQYKTLIRRLGMANIVICLLEIGFGSFVFSFFVDINVGAWWAIIPSVSEII